MRKDLVMIISSLALMLSSGSVFACSGNPSDMCEAIKKGDETKLRALICSFKENTESTEWVKAVVNTAVSEDQDRGLGVILDSVEDTEYVDQSLINQAFVDAVKAGARKCVMLLMDRAKNGRDHRAKYTVDELYKVWDIAMKREDLEIIQILGEGCKWCFDSKWEAAIYTAALSNNCKAVRMLLTVAPNQSAYEKYSKNVIAIAIQNNGMDLLWTVLQDCTYCLTEKSEMVRVKLENRDFALKYAIRGDHKDVMCTLLRRGSYTTGEKNSALIEAVKYDKMEAFETMIQFKADVTAKDEKGMTPIMYAAKCGNIKMMKQIQYHISYYDKRISLELSLALAARNNRLNVVEYLIDLGININSKVLESKPAIVWAAENGYFDVVRFLLNKGALVDCSDCQSREQLLEIKKKGHSEMLKLLLNSAKVCNRMTKEPITLLMVAVKEGDLEQVEFLVNNGAEFDDDFCKSSVLLKAAAEKHFNLVKILLDYDVDINAVDDCEKTVLQYAVEFGNIDLVKLLLTKGAAPGYWLCSVTQTDENWGKVKKCMELVDQVRKERDCREKSLNVSLMDAVNRDDVEKAVELLGGDTKASGRATKWDLVLVLAISSGSGSEELVRVLLDKGASPAARDKTGYPVLAMALEPDKEKIAYALLDALDREAPPLRIKLKDEVRDLMLRKRESTAKFRKVVSKEILYEDLVDAVVSEDLARVNYMMLKGANAWWCPLDAGSSLYKGYSAIHLTVCRKSSSYGEDRVLKMLKDLIMFDSFVINAVDRDGNTVLMYAANRGNKRLIEILLLYRAEINKIGQNGRTALHYAIMAEGLGLYSDKKTLCPDATQVKEVLEYLIQYGADPNIVDDDGRNPLHMAAKRGMSDIVKCLVSGIEREHFLENKRELIKIKNIDEPDFYGKTALMLAAEGEDPGSVCNLLECGANPNAKTRRGVTVLMFAVCAGHEEIVKLLLKYGANLNDKDKNGQTVLMYAVCAGHEEIVKLLLANDANLNAKDENGQTALMLAADKDNLEMTEVLLKSQANPNDEDLSHQTILMRTVCKGNPDIVKLLINHGANLETALMRTVFEGNLDIVGILLAYGADVNAKNDKGITALMIAVDKSNLEMIKVLLMNKANPNDKNANGQTALMYAASKGKLEIVKVLLKSKANPNDKDKNGQTALMHAAYKGELEIVKVLLANGADRNVKDTSGITALRYAEVAKRKEVVKLLSQCYLYGSLSNYYLTRRR